MNACVCDTHKLKHTHQQKHAHARICTRTLCLCVCMCACAVCLLVLVLVLVLLRVCLCDCMYPKFSHFRMVKIYCQKYTNYFASSMSACVLPIPFYCKAIIIHTFSIHARLKFY